MWNKKEAKAWEGRIYMAGDISIAKQKIREIAYDVGMCVTITSTTYLYSGGEEVGFIVGLIQYPRFPADEEVLWKNLTFLAESLAIRCCQKSFTISGPDKSIYFQSKRHNK